MRHAANVLLLEANAVSYNPLIFPDTGEVLSGGNFHAEPVAFAADNLALAAAEIGALAERRIALLIDATLSGLPPFLPRDAVRVEEELLAVRARGWALADEELAPGIRSVAAPVRDGTGTVRAAMNVTVHAAETSVDVLVGEHLPRLLRTAGDVSAEWALWQSRPHAEVAADRTAG